MARRRCGPRSTAAGKADRISALSDSLLCYILSFLPTKLAVATSILSKRWRPLYRSLLILDFDDQNFPNFLCFSNFVYSVILFRDITLPIQSFRLKCGNSSDFEPCDVNRFVYAAGQRGIENLDLDMSGPVTDHLEIQLPPCILSCRTLVVLKLKKLLIDDLSYVDFPLLKILHLDLITFTRYEYLMKLLSGSRILEDLQTKDLEVFDWALLDWEHFWEGKAESLPNLVRADISNLDIPFNLLYEAEFIRANLEGTYYLDNPKFHTLIHMELIFDFESWHGTWKWLVEVLEHCPKLQNLTIELSKCGDAFYGDDWNDPQIVPECLSSQLRTCSLRKYEGTECELQFVKYIMQSSKVLRTMTIHSTCSIDINVKHQMLIQLSSCPRGSATCKLLFD